MRETTRDRQREMTRRRLYEASLTEISRAGLAAASVDEITQAAGTSRTAYYFHFPRKEAVLELLEQRLSVELWSALRRLPADASLERVFAAMHEQLLSFWSERPTLAADTASIWLSHRRPDELRTTLIERVSALVVLPAIEVALFVDRALITQWMLVLKWGLGLLPSLAEGLEALRHVSCHGAGAPAPRPNLSSRALVLVRTPTPALPSDLRPRAFVREPVHGRNRKVAAARAVGLAAVAHHDAR
ncbi:MAG: TetR/AcrR family transcriptional regulator [Myxococcales bacterium]|nr:TetR/AcrR family transcriptional regulator [Myxococcales bacterium]MDP3505755.1 TetR/AcrR family transcriptional regulator [Myxococcales bacterium]